MATDPGIVIPVSVEADAGTITIEKLAAKLLELERQVTELGSKGRKAGESLAQGFGQGLGQKAFDTIKGFLEEVPGKLDAAVRASAQWSNEMISLAQRTGFATEQLQQYNLAAKTSGLNINQLTRFSQQLTPTLLKNAKAFRDIGLQFEDLAGLDPGQQFDKVAKALKGVSDPAQRLAATVEIFGKRIGPQLVPFINGLEEARQRAEKLGLVLDQKTIKAAAEFNDELDTLKETQEGLTRSFGNFIAADEDLRNVLKTVTNQFGEFNKKVQEVANNFHGLPVPVKVATAGIVLFGAKLIALIPTLVSFVALAAQIKLLGGVGAILTSISVGFKAVTAAALAASKAVLGFFANPIVLAAIGGAVAGGALGLWLRDNSEGFREFTDMVGDAIVSVGKFFGLVESGAAKEGPFKGLTGEEFTKAVRKANEEAAKLRAKTQGQAIVETVKPRIDPEDLKRAKELLGLEGQIGSIAAQRAGQIAQANQTRQNSIALAKAEFEIQRQTLEDAALVEGKPVDPKQLAHLQAIRDLNVQIANAQAEAAIQQAKLADRTREIDAAGKVAALEVEIEKARRSSLTGLDAIAAEQQDAIAAAEREHAATVEKLEAERDILKLRGEALAQKNQEIADADRILDLERERANATAKRAAAEKQLQDIVAIGQKVISQQAELSRKDLELRAVLEDQTLVGAAKIIAARERELQILRLQTAETIARLKVERGGLNLGTQEGRNRATAIDAEIQQAEELEEKQRAIIKATKDHEIAVTKVREAAEKMNAVFDIAVTLAEALGDTDFGKFIAGLAQGAQQAFNLGNRFKELIEQQGKLTATQKLQAVGAGAQVGLSIFQQNRQQLSGGKGALSGAASGAAFGAAFGPQGAVIGAIAGGLVGFFSGSKFRKIAKDAGKVLGEGLSKETVSKIEEDMKKLNLSAANAALLNITTAIEDTGKAASTFAPQISNLVKGIADGSIPAKEGLEELARSFGAVADEALKAGRVGDRALVGIIKQARASGVESPEIKAFVSEQLDAAAQGFARFAALFEKKTQEQIDKLGEKGAEAFRGLSDEAVKKLADNAGTIFGAVFNSLVSEEGIVGAVDKLKGSFDVLKKRLSETLGEEAVNKILGPFGAAFDTLGNEKLRPIFDGIDGLTQAMKGLANAGFLTTEQFTAIQQSTKVLFDEAIAGGADLKTSLLAVAPGIQAAISAAEEFGVPLDADTEKLKALAEQNGITFKTDPQRAMLDVLVSIADVLGAKIPASVQKMRDAVVGGTEAATAASEQAGEAFSTNIGGALDEAAIKWGEFGTAGSEAVNEVLNSTADLSEQLALELPESARTALDSLKQVQEAAARGINVNVGGGGATGGTGGQRNVTANVNVNLGINENPLAAADTAAAMRRATVEWTAEAIEDRIPSIIAAVEGS